MMPLEPYNEQAERRAIEQRYQRFVERLPYSLPRLQHSHLFLNVVEQLHREGWKDWHILLCVMNGIVNWHLERKGANNTPESAGDEGRALVRHFFNKGEGPEDTPAPAEYFTGDRMQALLDACINSYLQAKGAVFRPRGYAPKVMRRIVATRYYYFDLDVPHAIVFPDHTSTDISDEERLPTEKQ